VKQYVAYDRQVDSLNHTLPASRQLYIVCGKTNVKDATPYVGQDTTSAIALWMRAIIQAQEYSTDVPLMTAHLLDNLTQAIDKAPANAYLYYNRGNAYVRCIEFQHAVEDYTQAIQLDPHLAEAYYNRGLVRLALKQQGEAISDLSKAGELGLYAAYSILKRQRKN
jgi:tetratricopeptide (TPR) repeat protein